MANLPYLFFFMLILPYFCIASLVQIIKKTYMKKWIIFIVLGISFSSCVDTLKVRKNHIVGVGTQQCHKRKNKKPHWRMYKQPTKRIKF